MWELDHEESWLQKNWCFWTVVLEKTLESPLNCKEIQPVHPKENQSWVFIGRTDVEAETPAFGPLMRRADSLEKTLMLGKIEGTRRRGRQRMRWLDSIRCISANSGRWWETKKPNVLQSMGLERDRKDWATEHIWKDGKSLRTELIPLICTSAVWDQFPVLCRPECPKGARLNVTAGASSGNILSFSSLQSLSCVPLFATPWTAPCQAPLSITNSWSLLKLMSVESVMLTISSHSNLR